MYSQLQRQIAICLRKRKRIKIRGWLLTPKKSARRVTVRDRPSQRVTFNDLRDHNPNRPLASGVWLAMATLMAYWGLAGIGFLLRVLYDPAVNVADELVWRIGWGAYPTVGAVIVARQPHNRVAWLCCAIGFLLGPAFFGQDYAWYALLHEPGLPGGWAMAWLGQWPWYIALGLISFLLLLFPNGRLVSPRWRPVAWGARPGSRSLGSGPRLRRGPLRGWD
jgi:hypothetical protein